MKNLLSCAFLAVILFCVVSCSKYDTVPGDPLKTKIYTLDNGLKLYMTVNKDEPRIQTYIAVRSGGKNDPTDNTGLAHYLEHIMFKGTESFGTSDYASEKPILDQIEELFNVYRTKSDPEERKAIYHQIDSLSYAASLISIPNEYDKLMAMIGSQGTNAYTSNDVTCYVENIPSNQIDNWARIEADRFKNLVIRGFHTELEAVYEEFNMYMNDDQENAMCAIDSVLFKKHPYGLQQVIGTQEHLKNPSISAIRKQKATYYVPNNVAICVSGDFDPDSFVQTIEKYFGDWAPNPELPEFTFEDEEAITAPVEKTVYGTEADFLMMAWRTPGTSSLESEVAEIATSILYNGQAGLMDEDLMRQQALLSSGAFNYDRTDYGEVIILGYPKEGQSLQEVRDLVLAEVAKLRDGDFDERLVKAAYDNYKLSLMQSMTSNSGRADMYVQSFISGRDWKDDVSRLDRMSRITKEDVMNWAGKYLDEDSYALVYKRNGINPKNSNKIDAPAITPIATNRDMASDFIAEIAAVEVEPIEPVFVDYSKDMSVLATESGIEMLYKKNEQTDIATVSFRFDYGLENDPELSMMVDYLDYLGTDSMSASDFALEEYLLACEHTFSVGANTVQYSVSGLSENVGRALRMYENLIMNAVPDEDVLNNLKSDEFQARIVAKSSQRSCNRALQSYVLYGPEYVNATTMTNGQLASLTSEELLAKAREIMGKQHRILYYGPESESDAQAMIAENHYTASELQPLEKKHRDFVTTPASKVIIAPYDQRQFNYIQFSCRGEKFQLEDAPQIELYNEYFGGGMNTIVFQEMREARALAYSAGALLVTPSYKDGTYGFYAVIGSQNDKLQTAVEAFDQIINDMPCSDKSFDVAKASVGTSLRTLRVIGANVLGSYLRTEELGLTEPIEKYVYERLSSLTMDDIVECQRKWVAGRTYVYGILGDATDFDVDYLRTLGPVEYVSLDEIFGYEH